MECHQCHSVNPEGKKFCGDCGAQLSGPTLRQEIDAAINERLKDQKVVEVELTEAIVNRLTGWAKTMGYFIGIPLVLLGGALGFLGVKTFLDFSSLSKQAASQVAQLYQSKEGIIKLSVDSSYKSNTIYDGKRIVLAANIAKDRHSFLYTYMMHVLRATKPSLLDSPNAKAVASGLGDYYAASFLNDPKISPVLAKELGLKQPYIRNLENERRFDDHSAHNWNEIHSRGETWGGAFWEVRGLVGQETVDRALFRAWTEWQPGGDGEAGFARKFAGLLPAGGRVQGVFARRGLDSGSN